jgi:hypothetical protein
MLWVSQETPGLTRFQFAVKVLKNAVDTCVLNVHRFLHADEVTGYSQAIPVPSSGLCTR